MIEAQKSAKTWAREQLGIGYAVKDPIFLVRRDGQRHKLSSKCVRCSRWSGFSVTDPAVVVPVQGVHLVLRKPELLERIRSHRCVGCGLLPFAGAESISLRAVFKKSQGGHRRSHWDS